jgi:alginate O-acetyltransferase complex protein AlgI
MCFIPVYILILGFTIVVDYFAGILLETNNTKKRKYFLIASLIANIGVLAIFKYYNFINLNLTFLLHGAGFQNPIPYLSILLPIGLSFHTFQAMSYTIEVYRGTQKAERHFGIYALYVMFFPQLVAGPIERPQNLIHQFYEKHTFDYQKITDGLKLMAWGLFKKVVIADRLAILVNQVYDNPTNYTGLPLIIATIFFSFQIYCDFSGYSDIAIGAAQVMGFKLMKNFNMPYSSRSISEFWKRWHISLSTWFKDYLYISLGGNRVSIPRWYFNLFIVFVISGLWHGAKWTFIIWGALHGFYLISGIIIDKFFKPYTKLLQVEIRPILFSAFQKIMTFALVAFAWIFFRAKSFSDAIYISTHLFSNLFDGLNKIILNIGNAREKDLYLNNNKQVLVIAVFSILFLELVQYLQGKINFKEIISNKPVWFRWSLYYFIVIIILVFGVFDKSQQFIYFQF